MRLFLCEKPSQGKDIARVLGAGQREAGCYRGKEVVVTWCIGHLVEAVSPEVTSLSVTSLDDRPLGGEV